MQLIHHQVCGLETDFSRLYYKAVGQTEFYLHKAPQTAIFHGDDDD